MDYESSVDITASSDTENIDDLSEVIKLREELAFSQLEPYESDITHVIIERSGHLQTTNKSKHAKFTIHKKEIHNESIGDEYDEYFTIQDIVKQNRFYTNSKVTDTNHTRVLIPAGKLSSLPKLKKYITPNITDLNVSKIIKLDIKEVTYLLSFLYFGVYLEDPAFYDADYLDLNVLMGNKATERLVFLLKYFKYRIKSLGEEYAHNSRLEVDDEDIDVDLYTKKILPLLLMLKSNLQSSKAT